MTDLEGALRARRDDGGGAFVPYVTGGLAGVDADLLGGLAAAGADAVEVGVPFSDPVMDGGVIQEASRRALEAGTTPEDVLAIVEEAALEIPVAVMTYFNPVFRRGVEGFLRRAARAGVAGLIVPDLPADEAEGLVDACRGLGVAPVLLAAPGATADRLGLIAARSGGFVYCVASYGVTGQRDALSGTAAGLVAALRPLTDLPLLLGVGITTPAQAAEACGFADGVVVGSALVRPLLENRHDDALALARAFRAAIPA
ncbi:MAG TPA: tryptophan synthase subunit alpha [Actinomycetota bacterium]|nr:tryptophan synthase subunit alpha [Actinomycetota bacterium]